MPGQLTPDQLNDLVDILGGLYGEDIPQQPVEQDAAPQQKAAPAQQPAPPTLPQEPMQQAAPPPEQPAVPQQPQMPAPMQPQQAKVKPSPFANKWHKSLLIQTKARRGRRLYTPTVANAPKPPETKPTKPPSTPTIGSLVYNARPERPPAAQPFQQVETPPPEVPQDQAGILAKIKQEADKKGGEQIGTNLAHVIRTRMIDPSIASQYQAASIFSLDELTKVLNEGHRAAPNEEIDLSQYHDDTSPFVILSHPRQTLTQGGAPAVVVGEPYEGLVHQLEAAFPGVHFFPAHEVPSELKRSASQVAKPVPAKALLISPYAKNFRVGTKDEGPAPTKPAKPKEPPQTPHPPQSNKPLAGLQTAPYTPAPQTPVKQPKPAQAPAQGLPGGMPTPPRQPSALDLPNTLTAPVSQGEPVPPQGTRPDLEAHTPELPVWETTSPGDYSNIDDYLTFIGDEITAYAELEGFTQSQIEMIKFEAVEKARDKWYEHQAELERIEDLKNENLLAYGRTEIGKALKESKVIHKEATGTDSLNMTYTLTLEDGTKGLFKPLAGENQGSLGQRLQQQHGNQIVAREGVPQGTYGYREAFFSTAARLLGAGHLVPETVLREVDGQVGSLQHWIDNADVVFPLYNTPDEAQMWDGDEDLSMLAALDYALGNTDRNLGNWMVRQDGKIFGIDHGLTMTSAPSDWNFAAADRQIEILRHAALTKNLPLPNLAHWEELIPQLEQMAQEAHLGSEAIEQAKNRILDLLTYQGKTFSDLPSPGRPDLNLRQWFTMMESPEEDEQ